MKTKSNDIMLPKGITGFWSVKTGAPPFLDEREFRRMCHTLARKSDGAVTEIDTNTAARNFYLAGLSRFDQSVFLLQNIHYSYAAFAQRDTSGRFVLTQRPEWLQLPEIPVRFLSIAELNQDWRGLCGELGSEEKNWNRSAIGTRRRSVRSYLTLGTEIESKQNAVTFPPLNGGKVLAALAERLAKQGIQGI